MKIYLDFDGTVVEHQYPNIGIYNEGCFEVIKKLQKAGHHIILNTYRANLKDGTLQVAMTYLNFWAIEEDFIVIKEFEKIKIEPHPWDWNYFSANDLIYIDDICKNIPLKPAIEAEYPIVDWEKLDQEFEKKGIY
ncbi:MAG: hypothetical protein AB8F94_05700 [Saprospiraceae bacterium]